MGTILSRLGWSSRLRRALVRSRAGRIAPSEARQPLAERAAKARVHGSHELHVGSHVTLAVRGEVDIATADGIRHAATFALDRHLQVLYLDLRGVTFMDSQGVTALAEARRRLGERGAELSVVAVSDCVRWVLGLTGQDVSDACHN